MALVDIKVMSVRGGQRAENRVVPLRAETSVSATFCLSRKSRAVSFSISESRMASPESGFTIPPRFGPDLPPMFTFPGV